MAPNTNTGGGKTQLKDETSKLHEIEYNLEATSQIMTDTIVFLKNDTIFDSGNGYLIEFNTLLVESTKENNVKLLLGLFLDQVSKPSPLWLNICAFRTTTEAISYLTCSWIQDNSIFLLAE